MSLTAFLLALIVLLATPGPTNTLLALGGARQGPQAARNLLPAELTGYLVAVLPLAALRLWIDPTSGPLGSLIQIAAAVWVAYLALKLGRAPLPQTLAAPSGPRDSNPVTQTSQPRPFGPRITPRLVFCTTLINPKVLVIALILMDPADSDRFLAQLAGFILLVPAIGWTWTRLGGLMQGASHPRRAGWFQRLAALWLAALALGLAHRALAG